MFEFAETASSSARPSSLQLTLEEQLAFRLREHVRRLKRIVPVISVSVLALRAQNADLDDDVAGVLQHQASTPLDLEIEELEELLELLARREGVRRMS